MLGREVVGMVGSSPIGLATRLITHHFEADWNVEAYEAFDYAADTGALKVSIEA